MKKNGPTRREKEKFTRNWKIERKTLIQTIWAVICNFKEEGREKQYSIRAMVTVAKTNERMKGKN